MSAHEGPRVKFPRVKSIVERREEMKQQNLRDRAEADAKRNNEEAAPATETTADAKPEPAEKLYDAMLRILAEQEAAAK